MAITRLLAAVATAMLLLPHEAQAAANDISLLGIGRPASTALSDPAVRRYRALSGELALSLTPKAAQPAETLGVSGFEFSVVNTLNNIAQDADYWSGQPGSPVFEGVADGRNQPGALWTPTLQVRKGLPMSTDVGFAVSYLSSSRMYMMGADVKVALHESYLRYFPAIAARMSFNRMFGSEDLDIFTAEADLIASLAFGVGGTVQVTPYLGVGQLFAHVNSQVLDETPFLVSDGEDQRGGSDGSLYTFPTLEWNDNNFFKVFAGARLIAASFTFSYSLDVGFIPYDFVDSSLLMSHSFKIGIDT
ncbi:MAG: hypothetical protein AAFQ82_07710 [Myxococcota bacterium]